MPLRARQTPAVAVSAIVLALLALFIALPVLAVLRESIVISGPMPPDRLRQVTADALALLPEERRAPALARWVASADQRERLEALAAAFGLARLPVPWDQRAAFSEQDRASAAALAAMEAPAREAVLAELPVAIVMLHKRVALAFQLRDRLAPDAFDRLRNGTESRLGLDHYRAVFDEPYLRRAALNSLGIGLLAASATTVLGFLLAYGINRGGVRLPGLVRGLVLLPLVSPPVLIATATLMLFGRRGLVTHSLLDRTLGLIDSEQTNLFGLFGVIAAQTLSFLPAAVIVLENVLRKQDGRVEEAAAIGGAGRWQILCNVTLPLAVPGLKRAFVLAFMFSMTDFGNPLILGRDIPVLAGVVYDEMTAFRNTALATALCVWMVLPALLLFLALEALGGRRRYTTGEGTGGAPELGLPWGWRAVLTGVAACVAGLVLAIYGTIALGSVTRIWGVDWGFTWAHFTGAALDPSLAGAPNPERSMTLVWQSLRIALIAGPIGGLLGVIIATTVERLRPPGREGIAFLASVPAVLPGIILGIGYILAFNLPLGVHALSLTGGSTILVLNIVFANLTIGVLAARGALQRLDAAVEEAAESLGAGLITRFFQVTLPMLRPALLLGTLYVFVHAMTTLSSVIFLVSGDHKLAAVAIFNDASGGQYGPAAAKSMAVLGLSGLAMLAIWLHDRARLTPSGVPRP